MVDHQQAPYLDVASEFLPTLPGTRGGRRLPGFDRAAGDLEKVAVGRVDHQHAAVRRRDQRPGSLPDAREARVVITRWALLICHGTDNRGVSTSSSASSVAPTSVPDSSLADLAELQGLAILGDQQFGALHVLCRAMRVADADLPSTLTAILTSATTAIAAADHAGLNLLIRGKFEPQATLGSAPEPLDALQKRTGAGPCIDASRDQVSIDVEDMADDARWPEFAEAAVALGVRAMCCVPLWVDDRRMGSLSLYAERPRAFDGIARRLADLYATHAAVALLEAQRADQMQRALANRDIIGQAKGVLMAQRHITADQAFGLLKETSHAINRKVVDVATFVAGTGELPSPESGRSDSVDVVR